MARSAAVPIPVIAAGGIATADYVRAAMAAVEEIAAKLSLPLGTVKTQIHRAREQMCRLIAQGDER